MNELDLLKTHWQKDQDYIKFKKEDITQMIHKSSSSIVKWIFIICCLEFLLGFVWYFIFPSDPEETLISTVVSWGVEIVFYIVILYFIYTFFKLYKDIKNLNNTKILLENIIKVRNNANRYIQFNLVYINISFAILFVMILVEEYQESQSLNMLIFVFILGGALVMLGIFLFRTLLKLYYKLIYGILLKKLNKNYEELIAIEQGE